MEIGLEFSILSVINSGHNEYIYKVLEGYV